MCKIRMRTKYIYFKSITHLKIEIISTINKFGGMAINVQLKSSEKWLIIIYGFNFHRVLVFDLKF